MKEKITEILNEVEETKKVRILYAVESGSRAWGFASPDSDYDVRFIYISDPAFYMKLEKTQDVIEWQLDETFDVNGWDLQKALRLCVKSNPTLFEWANSPIVYKTSKQWEKVSSVMTNYFVPKSSLKHYLSMASNRYASYLMKDKILFKKYFYALRSIFACKWILVKLPHRPFLLQN
jgi:predicted nucleotidyltransferase